MMLTISGIPPTTKYKDLRLLIKTRCNLADFILDDLVYDINGLKKVRIGLANASEGAHLIKCLAGYRMEGCPLSVTPVGKTQMPGPGQQQNFNQPQNEYHNNDYNDSRPSPWGQQGNHQNQWTSGPMGQQVPQNTYGYQNQQGPQMQQNQFMPMQQHQNLMPHHNQHLNQQQQMQPEMKQFPQQVPPGRGPQNQGYGFQPKNNVPEPSPAQRSHVLRTVEIVDTPVFSPAPHQNRYPNQGFHSQDKSLTIMKDNFQGPSQYNMGHREPGPQGPTQQPWLQPQQQTHPFDKPNQSFEKPGYSDPKRPPIKEGPNYKSYDKDYDRVSPRRDMRKSPPRKMSPGRRPSPRVSPRRQSPRRQSPGRRSPGRRGSPSHRMEGGRSPGLTMEGPAGRGWRRASPSRSPGRTGSARYSPSRRLDKPDEFSDRGSKAVRPAYEPPTQAQNQAIYSGGYRPNIHNKSAYPTPGSRPMEQRDSPWQQDRDKAMFKETIKKIEDERNVPRLSYERSGGRLDLEQKRSRSPRKSRSPRRDKSPNRDNFKRHSPSPRSPRRSWALEKRRSPDLSEAPPPPIWPGQIKDKGNFEDIEAKRKPVWEYDKKALDPRRPDDERRFPGQDVVRVRRDLGGIHSERREELELNRNDRFPREGHKFSPRDDFDKKVPKFSPRDDFDRKVPKFSPRDDFDRKGPKFSPRDDFDKKGLKFEPRDDFEKKGPKFGPRDDFDKKQPVFGPRDEYDDKRPKFTGVSTKYGEPYQDSKFNRDDSKFSRDDMRKSHDFGGPRFSPRNDFDDRHDDYRKHDVPVRKSWETQTKPPEREVYGGADLPKREDVQRMEVRKNMLRKMSEELDKQFEDVHKRAQDFQKRAEEYRRDDRRRDYDRSEPDPKPCDDRSKHRDDDRRESRFDERRKENWNMINKANIISAAIKAKKEKACDEITQKILDKHNIDAEAEQNARVCQELKIAVSRAIHDMFGDSDVSFIELVVKFNAKYSGAGEDKLLRDVMSSFPIQFRPKRSAPDYGSEVPAKMYRRSPGLDLNKDVNPIKPMHVPEWDMTPAMPAAAAMTAAAAMPAAAAMQAAAAMPNAAPSYGEYPQIMNPIMPMMVPTPMFQPFQAQTYQPQEQEPVDVYNLYLCKDDFEPFSEPQADYLKKFLINQIVVATESAQGWAPDFTFKGLQGACRYELQTRDEASKNWLINFDFSVFNFFNILVYTKEEMWFERAAIWLPGHSRCRNIEPLTKLKLQNKNLEGANVGKWKFVKKIVTAKGTRVYVDMPPSAARALEKHKMTLSYELQKVNVFLKAVAIDKDAFDLGLKDPTLTEDSELAKAVMNSPMPSLGQDSKIVKIGLAGNKPLTIGLARKVREMLIYNIFKYHQQDGSGNTDFEKHGFVSPGYFGVIPCNSESKRWLMRLNIGKLNKQSVIVLGADDTTTRYIRMAIIIPRYVCTAMALEKLRQSNQGVKGLHFSKWKPIRIVEERSVRKFRFEVDIDVDSVETIINMRYLLDYVDTKNVIQSVLVKYDISHRSLLDQVKKYKAELHDSYDNTNMDLASSESEEEVVCLD